MRILITGAEGFLGGYLAKYLSDKYTVFCTYYNLSHGIPYIQNLNSRKSYMDVSDQRLVDNILDGVDPDTIIHLAGKSNVDEVDRDRDKAYASIVKGTFNIAQWCSIHEKRLIYISTNAVFSGFNAPYGTGSLPCPINTYGQYKLIAESIVNKLQEYIIIRPILMYGWNHNTRPNPVTFILNKLRNNQSVSMVKGSSYTNPLYVKSCCMDIEAILEKGKNNSIYHLSGSTIVDRYHLALKVAKIFNLNDNLIKPASDKDFKYLSPRPYDTSYYRIKDSISRPILSLLTLEQGLVLMKQEEGEHELNREVHRTSSV